MAKERLSWEQELEIIDKTMKAISGVTDPEELVSVYWQGVGDLIPESDFLAVSRRGETAPDYLITRSSRFTEHPNPWTERQKLPRMRGGLLGEIVYGNKPVIIEDLPSKVSHEDPAWFHLQGYSALVGLPQYEHNEGLNVTMMMLSPGQTIERAMIPMLHWQGGLFERGTQNLVLRNQLATANAALDREIKAVGEIQRSLLPAAVPRMEGVDIAAWYLASSRAGGDYYDFFPMADGRLGLLIADVSGHGTPAAVLMAVTRAALHARPDVHGSPGALMAFLNGEFVRSYTHGGAFVTAFYGVIDPQTCGLVYSSAGHNPPRLSRGGRVISIDEGGGPPLGVAAGAMFAEAQVRLETGDLLLLYTDGISEAMAPGNEKGRELFGVERIDAELAGCGEGAAGCIAAIRAAVGVFCAGGAAVDDQTMVAVRVG